MTVTLFCVLWGFGALAVCAFNYCASVVSGNKDDSSSD